MQRVQLNRLSAVTEMHKGEMQATVGGAPGDSNEFGGGFGGSGGSSGSNRRDRRRPRRRRLICYWSSDHRSRERN